jgi:RHS repeat-associated protein
VIDPNGLRTETTFDSLNRVLTVTRKGATSADDLITTHEYNALGDLMRTILPRGNVIEYGYDLAGRLLSIERKPDATTPGERSLYTLDQTGNRVKEKLQRWGGAAWVTESFTDYVYLNRCQAGKVVHGGGTVTEYSYDCDGNLEKVWDANHPKATNPTPTQLYAYDTLDRMSSVTQPWTGAGGPAAVTSYSYDVQDHLTAVTDAEGNTTAYTYSDRGLMTQEVSPVSGVTASAYNEHGELVTEIDARGVVVTRTLDVLNRVTDVRYPDSDHDTSYIYDTGPFAKGRLTGITRDRQTVAYDYDRFGRLTQDGALTYAWDKNGNRVTIGYPGYPEKVNTTYTHDFADREQSLTVQVGINPPLQLVAGATYKPLGPLSGLALGNGITEIRSFDTRYFPAGIQVPGRLGWTYGTDAVGNILSITDTLNAANNRTYGYQDSQYFLTSGNGPWGARNWTYDRIGNRLTETRGATTDTYVYLSNGTGGNTPKIDQLIPGAEPAFHYIFDDAGNVLEDGRLYFSYGDDKRLTSSGDPKDGTTYAYDGRGFLSQSTLPPPKGLYGDYTKPTYSSEGLLLHRFAHRNLQSGTQATVRNSHLFVFYFAGRPVATLDNVTEGPQILESFTTTSTWQYLTVDHLGTPILVTNPAGAQVWQGGFEPFGADYSSSPTILRFPGQWDDSSFRSQGGPEGLYYNVHRWYDARTGRYPQADPLGIVDSRAFSPRTPSEEPLRHLYAYGHLNPLVNVDLLGLKSRVCCKKIPFVGRGGFRHCYVEIEQNGKTTTCGLIGGRFSLERGTGEIFKDNDFDSGGNCGDWNESCEADKCAVETARGYPNPSEYRFSQGPNSNTFVGTIARKCGLKAPLVVGLRTPGWSDPPADPRPGKTPIPVACSLP